MRSQATAGTLALETDLRHALDRDEIALQYQPVISMDTGMVVGFEALMRWRHDERGMLPPDVFIPMAEETGLILPLGAWALGADCRQLATMRTLGEPASRLFLRVNVSRRPPEAPDPGGHTRPALDTPG